MRHAATALDAHDATPRPTTVYGEFRDDLGYEAALPFLIGEPPAEPAERSLGAAPVN
jgi:hypothetical protein